MESVLILFPVGIRPQPDAHLLRYQNPFCYTSDPWSSIAVLWQPLWYVYFCLVALPTQSKCCWLCHWWCNWDKGWSLPSQFHLLVWSCGLIWDVWWGIPRTLNPVDLGWRHAGMWTSCASRICLWGHVGLWDRRSVGISHRGGVVGTSHRCVFWDTN